MDGLSDIYTISVYLQSDILAGQAYVLLTMLILNTLLQLGIVVLQTSKKGWNVKLKETLITVFFMRSAVDAFRVSTGHHDDNALFNPLYAMIVNKGIEVREMISRAVTEL